MFPVVSQFCADGGSSFVKTEIPNPADYTKPKPMMTGLAHLGHLVIYLLLLRCQ